jgi:hypothetical protein
MENLIATSDDGFAWSNLEIASPPDPSTDFTDVFPHLFERASGEEYIAWTTTRSSGTGGIFCAPIESVNQNVGVIQLREGFSYSPRIVPIEGTDLHLMVWVSTSNNATTPDIFYQVVKIQ